MNPRQVASPSPRSAASVGRTDGPSALDEVDVRMVRELVGDGRLSVRALAERVHISRANAYVRLQRLLDTGVITGFTAQVDAEKLGLGTAAFVSVSIEQNSWRAVAAALRDLPSVERVALVGAEFDAIVQVRATDNHQLRDLVLEQIQGILGVKATRTWLIFEETVSQPVPLPGGRPAHRAEAAR